MAAATRSTLPFSRLLDFLVPLSTKALAARLEVKRSSIRTTETAGKRRFIFSIRPKIKQP